MTRLHVMSLEVARPALVKNDWHVVRCTKGPYNLPDWTAVVDWK